MAFLSLSVRRGPSTDVSLFEQPRGSEGNEKNVSLPRKKGEIEME